MPSVATQTFPGGIRVACLECGWTTGCASTDIRRPCLRKGCVGQLVSLGSWRPAPGLYTIFDLWDRGQLPTEAIGFGRPVRVTPRA